MTSMQYHATLPENPEPISLQELLQNIAPGESRNVSGCVDFDGNRYRIANCDISLHCDSDICGRIQTLSCATRPLPIEPLACLEYVCKNCGRNLKTFALRFTRTKALDAILTKIGEFPRFGKPLPAKLQRLVQPKRDLLVRGLRCENQGLGIGAFAYYRRLVEDEKTHLIDEVIKATEKVPGAEKFIPTLKRAKEETKFTRAIETIGDTIPDALRISGHNPLTILHQALSRDLHSAADEECLAAAEAIRMVLVELADRMSLITAEHTELKGALARLMNKPAT